MKQSYSGGEIITTVVAIKLTLLALFACFYWGWLSWGDRESQAAAEKEKSAEASQKEAATAAASQKTEGPASLLDQLLNLPPLDVEKSSKDEIGRYLSLIDQAKQQAEDRSAILGQRIKQLQALEATIDSKLKKLDEERQYFAKTLQQEKEIQSERLKMLVELYAKMEPKKAAPVFESMDKDLVVALFQKMKEKQVTKILEAMSANKSVEITEYFGRIGSAREYELLKEMNQSLRQAFDDCKMSKLPG